MRYIRFRVWILFAVLIAILVFLFRWAADIQGIYKSDTPITSPAITKGYPELYEVLYQRDAGQLTPFLSHKNDTVRAQAWRTLASTPVDSVDQYIALALQQNGGAAWLAISKWSLNTAQVRKLERQWTKNSASQAGIARVLGWQGDRQSLDFLLRKLDTDVSREYSYALALGRLLTRYKAAPEDQIHMIQTAFDHNRDRLTRAYLYGWYRGAKTPLASIAADTLMSRWQLKGVGLDSQIDQYVNKIMPARTTYTITNFYNSKERLEHEVQLSVELAKSIEKLELTSRISLSAKILLIHPNPHVKKAALQSIRNKIDKGGNLYRYLFREMISNTMGSESVWLQVLQTVSEVDRNVVENHRNRLIRLADAYPYLMSQILELYRTNLAAGGYLQIIETIIKSKDTTAVMYALNSLQQFWEELDREQKTEDRIEQLRGLIFYALDLQDRGIAYTAYPLLNEDKLFGKDDFSRINRVVTAFSLPDDIEIYQQFGKLYKDRFADQARPVIDSLAALQYAPLNRSLAKAGWDVDVAEQPPDFRIPDWDRLWELGKDPKWTLRTTRGYITIAMDPLRAPATISAIDSLSRAGAYDGVPFHRVVPNFVIQGGDFERKDGLGGPDFLLPTEASELEFTRGATGIASAGTDTEGSQYFLMLQWAPHLNGNYTRFGKVIEGMRVADRIEVGDNVLSSTWH